MKVKNQILFALSIFLVSATTVTAQTQPTSIPTMPDSQQLELQQLRQEKEMRDRVTTEVDRAFTHTTTLLNTLLFILTLFPVIAVIGIWLLRRGIIYQIAIDTQIFLNETKERSLRQLEAELAVKFKEQTDILKQEIAEIHSGYTHQVTNLISESQIVLEDLRQQRENIKQETAQLISESPPSTIDLVTDTQPEKTEAIEPQIVLNAQDHFNQGDSYFSEGRYLEANNSYNEAVKIEPNFPEARYQNSRSYAMQRRLNLAIGNLQWAMDLNPMYKEMAKTDPAFDLIRTEDQFKKMIE